MNMNNAGFFILLLFTTLYSGAISAQSTNKLLDRDKAKVCMSISVRASIAGLEDFELGTDAFSGAAGAAYEGGDFFELETNWPVYLMISGQPLSLGATSLATDYTLDGKRGSVAIGGNGSHKGIHEIRASTQLGDISAQLAGEYAGAITITVIPQIPILEQCDVPTAPIESAPVVEELESTLLLEAEILDEDMNSAQVIYDGMVIVPDEFLWAVVSNDGLNVFPFLAEYLAWNSGQIDTLSVPARTWWMFRR